MFMFNQHILSLYGVTIVAILLCCHFVPAQTLNGSISSFFVDKPVFAGVTSQTQNQQNQAGQQKALPSQTLKIKLANQGQVRQIKLVDQEKSNPQPSNHELSRDSIQIAQFNKLVPLQGQTKVLTEKLVQSQVEKTSNLPKMNMASIQDIQSKIINSLSSAEKRDDNSVQTRYPKRETQSVLSIFWRQLVNQFNNIDKNKKNQPGKQNFGEKVTHPDQPAQASFSSEEAIQARKQKRKYFVFITVLFGLLSLLFVKYAKIKQQAHDKKYLEKEQAHSQQSDHLCNDK